MAAAGEMINRDGPAGTLAALKASNPQRDHVASPEPIAVAAHSRIDNLHDRVSKLEAAQPADDTEGEA